MIATSQHRWTALIIGFGASMALMLAPAFLPRLQRPALGENRVLAGAPPWPRTAKEFRAFPKAVDAYVSDKFPARPYLIACVNYLRYRLGYLGTPRVVVGKEGWRFYDIGSHLAEARHADPLTTRQREKWMDTFAARTERLREMNVAYAVLGAPMKEQIYNDKAPSWAQTTGKPRDVKIIAAELRRAGYINLVDPYDALLAQRSANPDLYTPFDTHWTGTGAYVAYTRLLGTLKELGISIEPLPLTHFAPIQLGPSQIPQDTALMLGIASFVDQKFSRLHDVSVEGKENVTYLTDKHDWTGARVVDTGLQGKPVLQLTIDSFGDHLIPLLYPHFSKLIISHHQDGFYREDLAKTYHPDVYVLEFVESSLRYVMTPAIQPAPELRAKIAAVVDRHSADRVR